MSRFFTLNMMILFVLISACDVNAQQFSPQSVFDEANTHLSNGDYFEAKNLYLTILENGYESGALYLNLGIVYAETDSMGMSKYYLLKAESFPETSDQASSALEYVNSQFSRQSAMLPKLPWDKAVEWLNEKPGASRIFTGGFVVLFAGLIMLYLYWLQRVQFKQIKSVIISLIASGVLLIMLAFYTDYVDQRYQEAIFVDDQKPVYVAPTIDSNVVGTTYEGYQLTVDTYKSETQQNWFYIRLGNGQYGWMDRDGVLIL